MKNGQDIKGYLYNLIWHSFSNSHQSIALMIFYRFLLLAGLLPLNITSAHLYLFSYKFVQLQIIFPLPLPLPLIVYTSKSPALFAMSLFSFCLWSALKRVWPLSEPQISSTQRGPLTWVHKLLNHIHMLKKLNLQQNNTHSVVAYFVILCNCEVS